jgi:ABC-type phosphate transport system permease subunit
MKHMVNKTVGTVLVGTAIVLAAAFVIAIPFGLFM